MICVRRAGRTVAIVMLTALKITPRVCRWNGFIKEQAD
ncbi:hypothetical protein J2W42_005515 [Rhizobium tibeticum]|uniref:Uncharacterized protein n=1 Tax=Rhizobium tibeticum TaxID=501024 RepID=A0A1H8UXS9_9HYPH|nr:hypothetical protein [Rhizobium tibeticum]SEI18112.1 hypothetical protein RTCCBAU85039_5791 [Rhizobium tibeticum]SEP08040.1 hypothetical protein SAMN05216228_103730 [Rhizobium tibeticum]